MLLSGLKFMHILRSQHRSFNFGATVSMLRTGNPAGSYTTLILQLQLLNKLLDMSQGILPYPVAGGIYAAEWGAELGGVVREVYSANF
jgi:hypothetical protein